MTYGKSFLPTPNGEEAKTQNVADAIARDILTTKYTFESLNAMKMDALAAEYGGMSRDTLGKAILRAKVIVANSNSDK